MNYSLQQAECQRCLNYQFLHRKQRFRWAKNCSLVQRNQLNLLLYPLLQLLRLQ